MTVRAILFAAASIITGQGNFATVDGTINGPNGAVAAATIEARDDATGKLFQTSSSASGQYALRELPPGTYYLRVTLAQFLDHRRTVTVAPAQNLRIDISLLRPGNPGNGVATGGGGRGGRGGRTPAPSGPAPRGADGKPDLSGLWYGTPGSFDWGHPDLLAAAEAEVEQRLANALRDHPAARCLPSGVAPVGLANPRYRMVQTPSILAILIEEPIRIYREVYLDGRGHPKDVNPTWLGHSVGTWDGYTLVVDTTGFNGKVWLDLPFTTALPSTERLHVIERYRRVDAGRLSVEITIDDPGAYRSPWTAKGVSELAMNDHIDENICNENNKTPEHLPGK